MLLLLSTGAILIADSTSEMNEEMILTEGETLVLNKQYAELLSLCDDAISKGQESYKLFELRGIANRQLKNYPAALKDFEKLLNFNENIDQTYYYIGSVLLVQHRYENAIKSFSKTIEINPNFSNAYVGRITAYCRIGMYENALEDIYSYRKTDSANTATFIQITISILLLKYSWIKYVFSLLAFLISYILIKRLLRIKILINQNK